MGGGFAGQRSDDDARAGAISHPRAPASIVLRRRISWMDTDAAGIYHWGTVFRLAEEAEAALHTSLGIVERTFGATPRVRVAADFKRPLRFNDVVEVLFEVEEVGRSSVTYGFRLVGPDGLAVQGTLTACHIDRATGRAAPWPEHLRERLGGGGRQAPDLQWEDDRSAVQDASR